MASPDTTILVAIKPDGSGAKVIKRDLDDITKKSKLTTRSIGLLGRAFGLLGGVMAAGKIGRVADEMTLLTARIKQSTRSTEEFKRAFDGLAKSSKETGTDLSAAVDVFQRISFTRDEISATVDEMVKFTGTVQKLGVISGASTQNLQAGLTQLGQGLSSGVLRAEEFNSILENIPAVGKQIADEFGVTTAQLRTLVLEGTVLSEDVFAAILNSQEKVNKQFEDMPLTMGRAFGMLKNEIALSIAGFNEATGTTDLLAKSLQGVANVVRDIRAGFSLIATTVKIVMLQIKQFFNDIAVGFRDTMNKLAVEVDKLTGGLVSPAIITGIYDRDYSGDIAQAEGDLLGLQEGLREKDKSKSTKDTSVIKGYVNDYKALADGLKGADKETKKLKASTDDYGRILGKISEQERERANEIGDMLFDLGRGYTDLRSVAVNALNDILRSMARLSVGGTSGGGLLGSIGESIFNVFSPSLGSSALSAAGGASNIGVKPTGFATGGSFTVGGSGSTDSQLVQFMATPGEQVNVRRNGQKNDTDGNRGVTYNIDARGADAGVEQRIRGVLQEVNRLRKDVPSLSVASVKDANNRNLGFLS